MTEETRPILDAVSERVTWDAPIHTIADIEERPWRPRTINIKPSRVGPLETVRVVRLGRARGNVVYGGGQTELGVGRDHIQYLASIFHPDTPNDTAPGAYNDRSWETACRRARSTRGSPPPDSAATGSRPPTKESRCPQRNS